MHSLSEHYHRILPRLRYLFRRFGDDRCSDNAAALTYMSLFALVPLLTVLYTMASAVPAFQGLEVKIQDLMFQHFLPETSADIEVYLGEFSRQAKNLTGFGIAVLMFTAILMLHNIEKAFNLIWRTRENRNAVSSFLIYWAVLSLAPLTIGLALGISTYLASFKMLVADYDVIGAGSALLSLAPFALSAAGFTLLYWAVPNCRVPFHHAALGGLLTAIAFNTARSLFTDLVVGSSYTFIYGAFAAVPLFLLWIFLSWNIVLMGGVLVHSLSAYQNAEAASRPTVLKALDVLYLFWTRQQAGRQVGEIELLTGRQKVIQGLDSETWRELRDLFIQKKLIAQTNRGHYLLCRDLHSISFWQIKEWVNHELPLDEGDIVAHLPWEELAYTTLREQRKMQRETLDMSLEELFST